MYLKTFEQLTKDELYALMALRQQVFVVEQQSIYLDLDHLDQQSIHYLHFDDAQALNIYARYRFTDLVNEVKIERVVISRPHRGQGKGKELIRAMLTDILTVNPQANIKLSSQIDACEFYQKLGFELQGEPYDDGGIEHIDMQFVKTDGTV